VNQADLTTPWQLCLARKGGRGQSFLSG